MSDAAVRTALARIHELSDKIEKIDAKVEKLRAERAEIEKFIEQWERFSGEKAQRQPGASPTSQPLNAVPGPSNVVRRLRQSAQISKERVAAATRDAISARGEPISRADLFVILTKDKGLSIGGKNPEMVLSTMLWRQRDKIVRLPGGGYWLADRPSPDGKYQPGQSTDESTVAEMDPEDMSHAIAGALNES